MTLNVENLFDARDNADKDDLSCLPLAMKHSAARKPLYEPIEVPRWRRECLGPDWKESADGFRLRQPAKTILQAAGYGEVGLIGGRALRGIDLAFLSRLPLAGEPLLHAFDASGFPNRADQPVASSRRPSDYPTGAW